MEKAELTSLIAKREQLTAQLSQVNADISAAQEKLKSGAIVQIKAEMQRLGVTLTDLGGTDQVGGRRAPRGGKTGKAVMYRNEAGQTWGGGRGRKPQWIVDLLASGADLEKFRV